MCLESIKYLFLSVFLFSSTFAYAEPLNPKDYKWYRFATKNFVILSLDKDKGQELQTQIEDKKDKYLDKFGFPTELEFKKPCKILLLPNEELLKKCFGIKNSQTEVSSDGEINVWMRIDTNQKCIAEACLAAVGQKYGFDVQFWAFRGLSILSLPPDYIRSILNNIKPYDIKALLSFKESDYYKLDEAKRKEFDANSVLFCMLLRKEYGQDKMHRFIEDSHDPTKAINDLLGFKSFDHFSSVFNRYKSDINNDLSDGRLPDEYLLFKNKNR